MEGSEGEVNEATDGQSTVMDESITKSTSIGGEEVVGRTSTVSYSRHGLGVARVEIASDESTSNGLGGSANSAERAEYGLAKNMLSVSGMKFLPRKKRKQEDPVEHCGLQDVRAGLGWRTGSRASQVDEYGHIRRAAVRVVRVAARVLCVVLLGTLVRVQVNY